MGGLTKYLFSSSKAADTSGVHLKGPDRFMILKKGRALSPNLDMNRPSAAMHPMRRYTSLRRRGGYISSIAQILSGLASMPRCDTRKPKSFPEATPKTHLSGLSMMLSLRRF